MNTLTNNTNNIIAAETSFTEPRKTPLASCIENSLKDYFQDLEGHQSGGLYEMFITEVEAPMLSFIMKELGGNQSKAAKMLGINRTTLRKKLDKYGLSD